MAPENTDAFDQNLFRTEYSDPDLMRELIDMFDAEVRNDLEQARLAVSKNDATALHTAAHSLKGTIGNYFARHAYQSAKTLDELARHGDLTEAPACLADCEREMNRLQSALFEFRKTLG